MSLRRLVWYVSVSLLWALGMSAGNASGQVKSSVNLSQGGADMVASGAGSSAGLGEAGAAGDLNRDGFADLVVGVPGSNAEGRTGSGAVYVIYGRSGVLPSTVDFAGETGNSTTISGAEAGSALGSSVAIGDLNGDGFSDLILGAPGASPGGKSGAGAVYVIYGRSGSLPSRIDLSAGGAGVLKLEGEAAGDGFGRAVGSGNANGDGYADLVVGAPGASPGGRVKAGQAYLYYGGPSLGEPVRMSGGAAGDALGNAVAAGDLNRDGMEEILLAAPDATPAGGAGAGVVYVVSGRSTPLASRIDLGSSPAGVSRILGEKARDRAGSALAVGDLNGDRIGDLIVGARLSDPPGGYNAGTVYIVYGKVGSAAVDVDLSGSPAGVTRILGERANDLTGASVSTGDLNRDGFDDLVLGAPCSFLPDDRESETPGKVFVVYGRSGMPPVIDLAANPGSVGRITGFSGYQPNTGYSDRTGASVAAGDFNGDGFADLLVGAPGADPGGRVDAGRAYLFVAGPRPDLRVSSSGVFFGNVVVGGSRRLTVAVTNPGTATLSINTLTVSSAQFRVVPPGPYSLNPGDSLLVGVTFAPTAAGPQSGVLTITASNDPEKGFVALPLTGTGAQPVIDVPPSLSFGRVALGLPAVSTISIANLGTSDLTVRKITTSDSQFVAMPDSLVVSAGSRLRATVIFTPRTLGSISASMTLASDDPNKGTVVVALSGSAASPRISLSPSALSFGSVLIGNSFASRLTVSNLGDAELGVSRLASDTPQFAVFPTAFSVAPGKAMDVTVTFTPSSMGSQRGTLTLSTNDPSKPTVGVAVAGDGGRQPAIALSAAQLDFGTVDVGAGRDMSFYVYNRGDGFLAVGSVSTPDTQFVARPDSFTVAGKDSVKVTVRFSPRSGKDISAALLIASNDPATRSAIVTLVGKGALRVAADVNPKSMGFGEVEVGTRKTVTLTVYSRGNAPLLVRSVASSDTQFVARPDSVTIAGGDSARIAVTFSPAAIRDVAAALTVVTNDFARGAIQVPLVGSGTRPMRLSMDMDPSAGDQGVAVDTVLVRSCSAYAALYLKDALNLSSFNVTLRFSSAQLRFKSFSDVGDGEGNFLRSAGGDMTISAAQTGISTIRLTGALTNPTLATAPEGGGLLAVLQFDTFSTEEGLARGDSALVSVEQAVLTRLVDTGPDTVKGAAPVKLVFRSILGDCNADGVVDMEDFFLLANSFGVRSGDPGYSIACDLNRDGAIDTTDFFLLSDRLGTRAAACRKGLPAAARPVKTDTGTK